MSLPRRNRAYITCRAAQSSQGRILTHGSAGILGGESVGDLLQNTLHIAWVSAQSTPCRWAGNLNEGLQSGSSCFYHLRNDVCAGAKSQALVVSAKQQGIVEDAPALARVSTLSLPRILQWEGHQTVEMCQPRRWRLSMTLRARHTYSWFDSLNRRVWAAAWLSIQTKTEVRGAIVVRTAVTASCTAWSSASYTSALLLRLQCPSSNRSSCWFLQW